MEGDFAVLQKMYTKTDCDRLTILGRTAVSVLVFLMVIDKALAHDEVEGGVGFLVGLLHPALGFDHLLAMLSVGILSVQIGGKAIWHVPTMFVLIMIVGGALGMQDVPVPIVETGIAISVLVLGLALAAEKLVPEWVALISVAIFGTFHGHAHGTEMPLIANPWLYGVGFVLGTALIHLVGVFIGFGFRRLRQGPGLLRAAGLAIAGVGCYFLLAA
jgi:urease accessory protein